MPPQTGFWAGCRRPAALCLCSSPSAARWRPRKAPGRGERLFWKRPRWCVAVPGACPWPWPTPARSARGPESVPARIRGGRQGERQRRHQWPADATSTVAFGGGLHHKMRHQDPVRACSRSANLLKALSWRGVRVAEGARLESVFTRKGNEGSNPSLSARFVRLFSIACWAKFFV